MTRAERFGRAHRAADKAARQREARLQRAYNTTMREAAREMRAAFLAVFHELTADASWNPPSVDQITNVQVNSGRVTAAQLAMVGAIAGVYSAVPGIDFTVTHPVSQRILDKLGARVESTINASSREAVAGAIATSWAEGATVPDTADAIQSAVRGVSSVKATMLARTDLIGMSNGMAQEAISQVNDAAAADGEPLIETKTWVATPDDRTRDTHSEADGQTVPIDEPYVVGDALLMYPGDPDGPDEEVINCRCTEIYGEEPATGDAAEGAAVSASSFTLRINREFAGIAADMAARYGCGIQEMAELLSRTLPWAKPTRRESTMPTVSTSTTNRGGRRTAFAEMQSEQWHGDIAFEGTSTGDGRWIAPGALSWRDLPLTMLAMTETPDFGGHAGAEVAGRIDTLAKREQDMDGGALAVGVTSVYATGIFDTGAFGQDIERMVGDQILRGISIDMAVLEWAFRDPETGEILSPDDMSDADWERAFFGELDFAVMAGEIMAATVCATPAFADARIALLATAAPFGRRDLGIWYRDTQMMMTFTATAHVLTELTASGAPKGIAPLAPPTEWFFRPEAQEPTPLTITDDGEVYGHIALWDTCHTGYVNQEYSQCVTAPRSRTQYARFHVGEIVTAEGDHLPIGKLTTGTGHAGMSLSPVQVREHYDNTGSVAAFVRASDGRHGIWVCGATRSDMTPEQLRDLRANGPSGDWRSIDHHLELHACLAVPVQGFPVERAKLAVAAAGGKVEVMALILTASVDPEEQEQTGPVTVLDAAALAASIEGPDALHALIEA